MDRHLLSAHLQQARRHVAEGERHVRQQRELIAHLERLGLPSSQARDLLMTYEHLLELHTADRDRLANHLAGDF